VTTQGREQQQRNPQTPSRKPMKGQGKKVSGLVPQADKKKKKKNDGLKKKKDSKRKRTGFEKSQRYFLDTRLRKRESRERQEGEAEELKKRLGPSVLKTQGRFSKQLSVEVWTKKEIGKNLTSRGGGDQESNQRKKKRKRKKTESPLNGKGKRASWRRAS